MNCLSGKAWTRGGFSPACRWTRRNCAAHCCKGTDAVKTCIATVSISGDFREKLTAIAAAGFDGIEIFEQDFTAFEESPRDVGAMVRDHGLEIMLFQPFRDFEGLPEPLRARAFARAERKFDLMNELGTDLHAGLLIRASAGAWRH